MRAPFPNILAVVLGALCLMAGCDRQQEPSPADAGLEDAGMDGGSPLDGGMDAGTDGGPRPDAGTDGGMGTDGGTDGGPVITPCGVPYPGDPNGEPTFEPTALEPDGTVGPDGPGVRSAALSQGGTVSIIEPPQGGRVAFLGVRGAANLDPCGVTLLGALQDPISGRVQIDQRTLNLKPGPDGLGTSDDTDIFTFSNVFLCPNNWANQDVFDRDYKLTLILRDQNERSVTRFLTVRPVCDVPSQASRCRCICKQGYKLGDPCPE